MTNDNGDPIRIRCKLCGTVAESWHRSSKIPAGKVAGAATCSCGNVFVDSLGFEGRYRCRVKDRDQAEGV